MLNKEVYVNRRKKLKENFKDGLILIMGNNFSPLDCVDNTYPFIQDATFKYYFGIDYNGLIGLIDIDKNEEIIFGNDYTMSDIIWMGKQEFLKELAIEVGVEKFIEKEELKKYLENRKNIRFTNQYRADNIMYLSSILNINPFEFDKYISFDLVKAIIKQRNIKDKIEIEEIEKAVNITKEMHLSAMKNVKAGMKEYELVAEVEKQPRKYKAYYSFQTILSKNGQILHNHSHLNTLKDGDMVLLDCGALSNEGYCGDMTTTFPVSGKFTKRQKIIHNIVRDMFDRAKELSKAGITYKEVHLEACKVLAANMKKLGLMKGAVEDIVSLGAHALFMPHGLGHMMGMTVHDMENFGEINVGYDEEEKKSTQFGLSSLRLAKKLEIGNIFTIEPGIYFIPDLFEKWKNEGLHKEFLNYSEIEKYMDFGGIRMERDILIQEDGTSRILGDKFPRTADEIEEYMKEYRK
ncbi:Xaa-Pro dipeptidase [Fusobacterium vincentii ATCC 51190]|uniref:Xaa-Pro aminopeptidase n=1 Tax=Fusobacterium vincentii TaxID=155615 RepID=A0AAJ1CUX5_FUSVC|nr:MULTISPECIES: aminopeptidase P family protein [Fusobacterium]EJG10184.1 Xaa-Pro dipeptidase [Fusobacterium vincentii ATCC 51190]ERT44301.1 xaa-Pro dipeptidase [Fusobacterium nucleatum CTI-7]MCW0264645.1 aminopeptidase P family protein [Fusobacterium vincentii]STO30581.1 Xaa-Pro aminopeptidase [Fusobacterium vincentii]